MNKKIEAIRNIIANIPEQEEIEEFLQTLEEDIEEYKKTENELAEAEDRIDELNVELENKFDGESVFLGMDTITFEFNKGNYLIRQSFDGWVESVKRKTLATAAFDQ